jgi:hypothetical protein
MAGLATATDIYMSSRTDFTAALERQPYRVPRSLF